ncbi:hypothetical protein [Rummeliibacillus stabekisii]|uniref:hypothetical protein n=1 Tax=Rummeliibacillus stabekisii TaxID=241244 RepID=UPI0037192909
MNKEEVYIKMIESLGRKIATAEIEKAESDALLMQTQAHINELLLQIDELKKGGEKKDEAPVVE